MKHTQILLDLYFHVYIHGTLSILFQGWEHVLAMSFAVIQENVFLGINGVIHFLTVPKETMNLIVVSK